MTVVRKGQSRGHLSREEFGKRFRMSFFDPAFKKAAAQIAELEGIAWDAYDEGRKSPVTQKAGPQFADPEYALSVEWSATRLALLTAEAQQKNSRTSSRALVICGSARNDGTCPGENSKSFRLATIASETLAQAGIAVDFMDLSVLTSEYGRTIYPCKACVSTAMPLCHWPCSCYPNHSLGQTGDWMAEIYERWVSAHAILIVTPVYWYQAPSPLKLMIDRLVCADGGNPDPTSTSGKDPDKAKAMELAGWNYPKHLSGRVYGVVVHGDAAGIEESRRTLCDWLDDMELVGAGTMSRLDRYIGYYKPYATSHEDLDTDTDLCEEVRNVARSLAEATSEMRAGRLSVPDKRLQDPRPK
jgi:multimeric flavodoxin WrbA